MSVCVVRIVFFLVADEQAQKSSALHNFEKVYSHAMKLQVQVWKRLDGISNAETNNKFQSALCLIHVSD